MLVMVVILVILVIRRRKKLSLSFLGRTYQGKIDLVTRSAGMRGQDDHVLSHELGQTHWGK